MASNLKTPVWTFDLPSSTERKKAFRGKTEEEWFDNLHAIGGNITFYNVDLLKVPDDDFKMYMDTWFVMLDTHHRPYTVPFEREFFKRLVESGYKGLLLLDDINEHDEMRRWWQEVQDGAAAGDYRTFHFTPVGHWSGTGFVDFSGKLIVKDGPKTIEPLTPFASVASDLPDDIVTCDSSPCDGVFAYSGPNHNPINALKVLTDAVATYSYGNEMNTATDNTMIFMPTNTDPQSCVSEWKQSRFVWIRR